LISDFKSEKNISQTKSEKNMLWTEVFCTISEEKGNKSWEEEVFFLGELPFKLSHKRLADRTTRWVCEKNRPKCSPKHFCENLHTTFTTGKIIA
jgi:hypothetical protein